MILKSVNLTLRFILELCLLAVWVNWGFVKANGFVLKLVLSIGIPIVIATVWGTFLSPKAKVQISNVLKLLLEIILFGLAVTILYSLCHPILALLLGIAFLINRVLIIVWRQ